MNTGNFKSLSLGFLLIVIAKASFRGNRKRLNWNGKPDGVKGILGISTLSPFTTPFKIVALIMLVPNAFTISLVSLHNLGASRFRMSLTRAPTFNSSLWDETPDNSNEFKKIMNFKK
jgi:hypothetical protein